MSDQRGLSHRPVRVLHVISRPVDGDGITEVVRNLASCIDRERFEISVCSLQGAGNGSVEFNKIGVKVFSLNATSSASLVHFPQNMRAAFRLAGLIKRGQFGVVHAHEFFSGTIGRFAAWLAGAPIIVLSLHSTDHWKQRPHILVDRCLARVTDKIVANSGAVREFAVGYEGISTEKFVVIRNGIDQGRFSGQNDGNQFRRECNIKPGEILVGSVGHLAESKGQRYLVEAASIVRAQRGDVAFAVVGGDASDSKESVSQELHQRVKELGLEDVFLFTGHRHDMPQVMAAFDVFVFPSLWEGFGLVVAEAMAAGKPVVASRIGAMAEVVREGETGILVSPGDAVALAAAITHLIESPQDAVRMGKAGRNRVEELFSRERMAREYEALYECLGAHKRSQA